MKGVANMENTKKNEFERVNINLPSALVVKVKEYAKALGINATSAYIVLLNQALDQKEMLSNMSAIYNMTNELQKLGNAISTQNTLPNQENGKEE